MAEKLVLGLFHQVTSTADAIAQLRQFGVTDDKIIVMSSVPYEPEMLARPGRRGRLGWIVLLGAILGVLTGLVLTVGLFLLYPLTQGGQPLVPVPPSLIIIFEVTMLGTMWAAFFGFLLVNRFPMFGRPAYDVRITAGDIAVQAQVSEQWIPRVERILRDAGAHDVQLLGDDRRANTGAWASFVAIVAAVVVVAGVVSLLFFYNVLRIAFPSQMVDQVSIAYEQGPRLAAPAAAVPIQGPALIAGEPATEPISPTADSIQRGKVLFGINCVMCHGSGGTGNGTVGALFTPKPSDLTSSAVQNLSDADIFLVLTQGFNLMPSLSENLSPQDRWDVINYVRTLKK
jgi:mono/diheme cytochrome c family protein